MDATPSPITIATYNVHACVGVDRRRDEARVSRVIAELDADVVALQEFMYPADVALEARSLAAWKMLDPYQCALGPTDARGAKHYGNLVLTRHPIREVQRLDLSVDRREPRGALAVTIDVRGAELHVIATHLGLKLGERRAQIERLLGHVDSLNSKFCAIAGDFNDWLPGRSVVQALDERFGRAAPRSFPGWWPLLSLDRIWVHPGSALREIRAHKSPLARVASDHLPVVAVVDAPMPA